jgi:hypothetical protein
MIDIVIASSLSQVLASNYIKEKALFVAKSACIGAAVYAGLKVVEKVRTKDKNDE